MVSATVFSAVCGGGSFLEFVAVCCFLNSQETTNRQTGISTGDPKT